MTINDGEGDRFLGLGVPIALQTPDDFKIVIETLSRIGIASEKSQTLTQSVHILHKRGSYALLHFKELFILDGKASSFTEEDKARRNTIANLLHDWGLVVLVDPAISKEPVAPLGQIKIIAHRDKGKWTLVQKYQIGKPKRKDHDKPWQQD